MEEKQTMSRTNSKRQKRRKKKKRTLSFIGLGLLIVFLGVASVLAYGYWKFDDFISRVSESGSAAQVNAAANGSDPSLPDPQNEKHTEKPFAVAIIGMDTRASSGGMNTDVIMVGIIDPEDKDVHLLSIPRDTKVEIPGYSGYRKINSAYALGDSKRRSQEREGKAVTENGFTLVKKTLSEFLGIPIHFHVQVDFDGFVEVVDAVGGVKVNVSRSMQYDDPYDGTSIHIRAGEQELDGENALGYVRHRLDNRGESYQSSDFERNARQQEVIKAVIDKLVSFKGLSRVEKVIDAVAENVSTNLSPSQLKKLTRDFITFRPSDLMSIENHAYWDSRQSFTVIPEDSLSEIQQQLQVLLKLDE